jgi:hypothetical protein
MEGGKRSKEMIDVALRFCSFLCWRHGRSVREAGKEGGREGGREGGKEGDINKGRALVLR